MTTLEQHYGHIKGFVAGHTEVPLARDLKVGDMINAWGRYSEDTSKFK